MIFSVPLVQKRVRGIYWNEFHFLILLVIRGVIQAVRHSDREKKASAVSLCVATTPLYMSRDVAFLVLVFFFLEKKKSVDVIRNISSTKYFFFLDNDEALKT